jgi:hypothetical protein
MAIHITVFKKYQNLGSLIEEGSIKISFDTCLYQATTNMYLYIKQGGELLLSE